MSEIINLTLTEVIELCMAFYIAMIISIAILWCMMNERVENLEKRFKKLQKTINIQRNLQLLQIKIDSNLRELTVNDNKKPVVSRCNSL